MVNRLLQPLKRWPAVEAAATRLVDRFTTWPVDEYRAPEPMSIAPATFEMRFMRLHAEARFDEMWEMLAEDAQRAWGGRDAFIRDMPRLDDGTELLDIQVLNVKVLERWTDRQHERSYSNVAQMMLRYRFREERWGRMSPVESTLDRQVHLIPAAGGWRTLCYPAVSKGTAQTR